MVDVIRRGLARLLWESAFLVSPDEPVNFTIGKARRIDLTIAGDTGALDETLERVAAAVKGSIGGKVGFRGPPPFSGSSHGT